MRRAPLRAPQVVAIGCCFLDYKKLQPVKGNLEWSVHHGGVGRNLAENLGRCGVDVGFITLARPGMQPRQIFARLSRAGVRVAARETERGVGEFRVELDARGNLLNSSAEIPRLEALDWRFASRQMEWLCRARWIVVETGLDETLLGKAMDWAARRGTPVCGLPTRLRQTGPRWHILRRTSCLILNHQEAAQILEMPVRTATDANLAVRRLLSQGISSVAITMGAQGVVTAQRGGAVSTYRAPAARVVDSTGAGDAFAAALIASLVTGRSFARGIVAGLELARQTVESRETVVASPAVSTWRMPNDERHP